MPIQGPLGGRRIFWSRRALAHVQRRHGIELEEVRMAERDPRAVVRHAKRGRFLVIGEGRGGRILSLVVERRGGDYWGVTARRANAPEIALYRGP